MVGKELNKKTGNLGEDIAVQLLKDRGYAIIQRNFRCRLGEIDIVARDGRTVVFVEVKTRKGRRFGEAEEAVDYFKQMKLRKLAQYYLLNYCSQTQQCRFDVCSIYLNSDDQLKSFRILENCL